MQVIIVRGNNFTGVIVSTKVLSLSAKNTGVIEVNESTWSFNDGSVIQYNDGSSVEGNK